MTEQIVPIETIVAQATPPGHGGVAIIRASGPCVKDIMLHVLGTELVPKKATYLSFKDEHGVAIDEGVAIYFRAPFSFTGEDVLELQGHGGPVVVQLLIGRLLGLGARLARPGEFSLRAFLNGKIDLIQAEAIADLVHASSKQAARSALRSLQGSFSKEVHKLNEQIITLRAYIEAAIDFSEEEIEFLSDKKIIEGFVGLLQQLTEAQRKAKQGSLLREGPKVVIAGSVNVGKSSLLNVLSGKETAIVTDVPGTTRDVLRDHIDLDGLSIHIVDTAGLRESEDVVEQEGMKRAHQEIAEADLILYVMDASKHTDFGDVPLPSFVSSCPIIFIYNKIDLLHKGPEINFHHEKTQVYISVKHGLGLSLLKGAIKKLAGPHSEGDGVYLARTRHLDALANAKKHIESAFSQLQALCFTELIAEDLRLAHLALGEIIGEFHSDDLLGQIFSSFCIGK